MSKFFIFLAYLCTYMVCSCTLVHEDVIVTNNYKFIERKLINSYNFHKYKNSNSILLSPPDGDYKGSYLEVFRLGISHEIEIKTVGPVINKPISHYNLINLVAKLNVR